VVVRRIIKARACGWVRCTSTTCIRTCNRPSPMPSLFGTAVAHITYTLYWIGGYVRTCVRVCIPGITARMYGRQAGRHRADPQAAPPRARAQIPAAAAASSMPDPPATAARRSGLTDDGGARGHGRKPGTRLPPPRTGRYDALRKFSLSHTPVVSPRASFLKKKVEAKKKKKPVPYIHKYYFTLE
jgi:hypothetical protein